MSDYLDRTLYDYLPGVLQEVREYKALCLGEQPEIYAIFEGIDLALKNMFVMPATEYGVKRWERLLNIIPPGNYTLEERKFAILARLGEFLPYTYRMLERLLTSLCGVDGFSIDLKHNLYSIQVNVKLAALNKAREVEKMLKRVIPANLVISLGIEYNSCLILVIPLRQFTWARREDIPRRIFPLTRMLEVIPLRQFTLGMKEEPPEYVPTLYRGLQANTLAQFVCLTKTVPAYQP